MYMIYIYIYIILYNIVEMCGCVFGSACREVHHLSNSSLLCCVANLARQDIKQESTTSTHAKVMMIYDLM